MRYGWVAISALVSGSALACDTTLCWQAAHLESGAAASASSGSLLGLGLGLAAAAGGGGGGGGGSSTASSVSQTRITSQTQFSASPNASLVSSYNTSEYRRNSSLDQMNPRHTWSVGGLGAGVTVQVIDSGINAHSDLAGRLTLLTDHTGVSNAGDDQIGHGTAMAGIIAAGQNDQGVVGVAPQTNLLSSKIFDSSLSTTSSNLNTWLSIAHSQGRAQNAQIISNSWGSASLINDFSRSSLNGIYGGALSAWRSAVNAGQVVVFAAGNEGASSNGVVVEAGLPLRYSELTPGWLAVTAVTSAGQLASYANPCGSALAWCLAAPGSATTLSGTSTLTGVSGTSASTAYVSGALAALGSAFPSIPMQQIRQRLLETADKSLDPDGDQLGQGVVDLQAALSPVGGLTLSTSGSSLGAAQISLQPGPAIGQLPAFNLTLQDQQAFPFQVQGQLFQSVAVLGPTDGIEQYALTQAVAPGFAAVRGQHFGVAQLSGLQIGQWLSPQRWGSLDQAPPMVGGMDQSWVTQYQIGPWRSYSAGQTDGQQGLSGVDYRQAHWGASVLHHREDASFLGLKSEGLRVQGTETTWVGAYADLAGVRAEYWVGQGANHRLDRASIRFESGPWQLGWQLPTAVDKGTARLSSDWQILDLDVSATQREQRWQVLRYFDLPSGWSGFARGEAIQNHRHQAGQTDQQFSAGFMRLF